MIYNHNFPHLGSLLEQWTWFEKAYKLGSGPPPSRSSGWRQKRRRKQARQQGSH